MVAEQLHFVCAMVAEWSAGKLYSIRAWLMRIHVPHTHCAGLWCGNSLTTLLLAR